MHTMYAIDSSVQYFHLYIKGRVGIHHIQVWAKVHWIESIERQISLKIARFLWEV